MLEEEEGEEDDEEEDDNEEEVDSSYVIFLFVIFLGNKRCHATLHQNTAQQSNKMETPADVRCWQMQGRVARKKRQSTGVDKRRKDVRSQRLTVHRHLVVLSTKR